MKAIRVHEFGGPEKLVLEDVPDLRPGNGEVLVEVKAAGANGAADVQHLFGRGPRFCCTAAGVF